MKRGCPTHPKTYALADLLDIPRVQAIGILELLFPLHRAICPAR